MLLALWAVEVCLVAAGSLLPDSVIPFEHLPNDKVLHFWGYFVAAALTPFAFERLRISVIVSVLLVVLGVAIEYAQRAMSLGRSWDPRDMAANALGVISGLSLAMMLRFAIRSVFAKPR